MEKVDFDNYSDNYDEIMNNQLSSFEGDVSYFAEYKIIETKKALSTVPKSILDFGCGVGRNMGFLSKHFSNSELFGCDISSKSILLARKEIKNVTFFELGQDIINQKFDLIFISNVFHHIAVDERPTVLTEQIIPLLNENGNLIIFEHNPYNPITLRIVANCEFDADAELIKKKELIKILSNNNFIKLSSGYIHFFPSNIGFMFKFEKLLKWFFLGAQYFCMFKKNQTNK